MKSKLLCSFILINRSGKQFYLSLSLSLYIYIYMSENLCLCSFLDSSRNKHKEGYDGSKSAKESLKRGVQG